MNARLITTLTASLCIVASATAQSFPETSTWSTTATGTVASQYMFRGVRLSGPAFQPAIEVSSGNLTLGIWSNFPFDDTVPGQSDPEVDPYGSFKIPLAENLTLQPGFTWYTYPRAEKNNGFYKSTFEPNLGLSYTVGGITFTPKIYYDIVLEGATYEVGAFYALPLAQLGTELDFSATFGTFKWKDAWENTTPRAKHWGDYWQVGVAMPYQITRNSKIVAGVSYMKGRDHFVKLGTTPKFTHPFVTGRAVFSLSYAVTF